MSIILVTANDCVNIQRNTKSIVQINFRFFTGNLNAFDSFTFSVRLYSGSDGTGKIWKQEDGGKIIRYRCYTPDGSHWWQLEYRTNAAGSVTSIDMLFEP